MLIVFIYYKTKKNGANQQFSYNMQGACTPLPVSEFSGSATD